MPKTKTNGNTLVVIEENPEFQEAQSGLKVVLKQAQAIDIKDDKSKQQGTELLVHLSKAKKRRVSEEKIKPLQVEAEQLQANINFYRGAKFAVKQIENDLKMMRAPAKIPTLTFKQDNKKTEEDESTA